MGEAVRQGRYTTMHSSRFQMKNYLSILVYLSISPAA